jgi:hypothetical protein
MVLGIIIPGFIVNFVANWFLAAGTIKPITQPGVSGHARAAQEHHV